MEEILTKKNSTLIVVVLDRSGSMESCKNATLEGFNRFLYEQKLVPGEARMTLIQFDDRYEPNYHMAPLEHVRLEYAPRGGTALLDAMGRTIDEVGAYLKSRREESRPDKVIFVTITDGQENASRIYTRAEIFKRISHQRDVYQWEFLFLGANQDAIAAGAAMGIPATHSMSYASSEVGTQSVYGTVSQSIGSSRGGGSSAISNQQRDDYNKLTGTNVATPATPETK